MYILLFTIVNNRMYIRFQGAGQKPAGPRRCVEQGGVAGDSGDAEYEFLFE